MSAMGDVGAVVEPRMRITGCPLLHHPGNSVVGISRSVSTDEVLVTVQSAGLMLQTLSEQVTTASITSPSSRRFQCPAVQHTDNGNVYAALSSPPEVRVWDSLKHGFADGASVPLPDGAEVHSLHTATTIDGVVVVFEDGTSELLPRSGFTPPNEHRAASPARKKNKRRRRDQASVVWAELLIDHHTHTSRLLQLTRGGPGGDNVVHVSSRVIAAEAVEMEPPTERVLQTPDCGCLAVCFQWPASIFTLWEDGTLWSSDVGKGGSALYTESDAAVPAVQNAAFRGFVAEDQGDRAGVAVMVVTSTSHITILAKMGEPTQLRGFLWDTAFSTLQADANVGKFTGVQWSPKDAVTGGIGKGVGCAIFSSTGTVVALNFPAGAAAGTLAAAVNKLGPSRRVVTDDWIEHSVASVTRFQPAFKLHGKHGKRVKDDAEKRRGVFDALVQKVLDPAVCTTSKALNVAIDAYISAAVGPVDNTTDGGLQHYVTTMVRRCLEEKRYFAGQAIERLLALECVSLHHCTDILDLALVGKKRSLLRACLTHLDGISEQAMLRCFSELYSRNGGMPATPQEGAPESELQEFLRLAYSRGWAEEELIGALQPIALDGILFLVENLRWWLAELNEAPPKTKKPTDGVAPGDEAPSPTLAQVLDWTAAVVDAKFATLVHSIESHDLVREINGLLEQQRELCEQMMGMSGLLARFIEGKALPRSHAEIGPYSIEILNLSL